MEKKIIHPDERFKIIWDLVILLATIGVTIQAPLVIVFDIPSQGFMFIFDMFITVLFICDIVINFNTGFIVKREFIQDYASISKRYLKFWFWMDLLATIPFYAFIGTNLLALNRLFRFFRISRLLKLFTGSRTIKKAKELNINPSIMRLILLVFWVFIASHLITCAWVFIDKNSQDVSSLQQYIRGFYWTVTTLTTIGYGDVLPDPTNQFQMVFTIVIELLGAGMYGFIIGNIANLISNIDIAKSQYREKVEKVNTFLKYRNIPMDLQKRINNYYDYLWESRRGYDESSVLSDLPRPLQTQVSLYINKEIIEKVPIFQGASPAFLKEIINSMQPVVFTPGDYIVTKGEIGDEMYFISQGTVDVVSEDESIVYATLSDGSFFGEIALLLSSPRTATIKAKDYCDLYLLRKNTFDRILLRYPSFAKTMEELAEKRRQETKDTQAQVKREEEKRKLEEKEALEMDEIDPEKLPGKVTGVKVEWDGDREGVHLNWDAVENASSYTVLRKAGTGQKWKALAAGLPENIYHDSEPFKSTMMHYRVRAVNSEGSGPWSEIATLE